MIEHDEEGKGFGEAFEDAWLLGGQLAVHPGLKMVFASALQEGRENCMLSSCKQGSPFQSREVMLRSSPNSDLCQSVSESHTSGLRSKRSGSTCNICGMVCQAT